MVTDVAAAAAARTRITRSYAAGALLAAGAVATAATTLFVFRSPILLNAHNTGILRGLLIACWVAAGTYMWWQRPESRLGLLLAGAGFVYAGTSLMASEDALAYTVGRVTLAGFLVFFAYIYLCFPGDRLIARLDRRFIGGFAAATVLLWPLVLAFSEKLPSAGVLNDCRSRCPRNALQIAGVSDGIGDVLNVLVGVVSAAALVGVAVALILKARSPLRLRGRAVEPVLYAFAVVIASYIANLAAHPTGRALQVAQFATAGGAFLTPAAMLAGQARARSRAFAALSLLVVRGRAERVTPAHVQEWLRDALGDPSLEVALWDRLRFRFVGVDGRRVDAVAPAARATTSVTHEGRPVAVLTYSATLQESAAVVEGLAETALMLLENARLVEELRASRARIVASADHERHRLERDLHDGAQQRLFLLQIKLARLRGEVGDSPVAARIEEIESDAGAALEELRVLAHGIYPTVLVERGVPEALRAFAADATLPVGVTDHWIGRCSPTIEAALYFCALEAIQNAAKHAGPARVTVDLDRDGDRVDLSVADDGVGFQAGSESDGIGLVTMRDRIGAVGGELEIVSEPGRGVTVHVTIPHAPGRSPGDVADSSKWRSA